jgi:hypothetical protein
MPACLPCDAHQEPDGPILSIAIAGNDSLEEAKNNEEKHFD